MATILVIDDDDGVRKLIATLLERAQHRVIEATDGVAGLKAFKAASFDLVITDLIMPEKEGLETIRELRMDGGDVKILAISGGFPGNPIDILDMARNLGADAVLGKPFTPAALLAEVARLLALPAA
ncbi:MAG: response regulator transcription factor [Alphaproteobacteria bacterium]